jgi:RNA polymerase sigma factor (sigma-70 family)
MVKAVCQRILADTALAEDAAQEVFLLLVRKLPSLRRETILGGWLYVTACQVARAQLRKQLRRSHRETQAMEYLMKPAQDTLWRELEPLLDDAMLTLPQRQRELVLSHYFQDRTQRAAAGLVGCSESVASRELSAAVEHLRRFFSKRGITVSGTALVTFLTTHGAEASIGAAGIAATLSSASALAGASTPSLFLALMKTTTATKIIVGAAAALLITTGTIQYLARENAQTAPSNLGGQPASAPATTPPQVTPNMAGTSATISQPVTSGSTVSLDSKAAPAYDAAALKAASDKQKRFFERMGQFALMGDPLKVQELLKSEYGIQLSVDEIRKLQSRGQKGFGLGIMQLWPANQPQEALAWATSVFSGSIGLGVDLHQSLLDSARKTLPNLSRGALDAMLPEGPGKAKMLDLIEAATNPHSLANRILNVTDPAERASRLKLLAQGWSNSETSATWARENLSGSDRTTFYAQVGYNLAEQNPQAALQVLAELRGTDAYASTFMGMMRGLVQEGGQGQRAAELIANSDLNPRHRTELISELARRWVRSDADAAIAWVNTLTAPEDFRAAIPLLVSQLDNDRVSRTVQAYLQNLDPVMELGLIEAAAPPSLSFDSQKARLILDPLINRDPTAQLRSGEGTELTRDQMLWNSVNLTAKRQAEEGRPAAAVEWLGTLPFASQTDYARTVASVLTVWNLTSPTDAAGWLQNAALNPTLKADLLKMVQP